MANNVVLRDNLDADAVVDTDTDKIRFLAITSGTGAPVAAPSVPEKDWLYVDTTDEEGGVPYHWVGTTGVGAWAPVAGSVVGADSWLLAGNLGALTGFLGTLDTNDLSIGTDDVQRILIDGATGDVLIHPDGQAALGGGATQQVYVGVEHPDLAGRGIVLYAGDEDDPTSVARKRITFSDNSTVLGDIEIMVQSSGGIGESISSEIELSTTSKSVNVVVSSTTGGDTRDASLHVQTVTPSIYSELAGSDGEHAYETLKAESFPGAGADTSLRWEVGVGVDVGGGFPQPDRAMELNTSGLELSRFVKDVGEIDLGVGGEYYALLSAPSVADAPAPGGNYMKAAELFFARVGAELRLQARDDLGVVHAVLATIPLTLNAGTGNYEITA